MRKLAAAAGAVVLLLAVTFWLVTTPQTVSADQLGARTADVANGREMFFAGGCAACHARPGESDRTLLGGGLELRSPFGTFHVPNISPDPDDGIGRWSEAAFVSAMIKGTSPDGQHYYPAFPYTSYQRMAVTDVRDLFAFFKTLPPVKGKVRDHDMRFPFGYRRALGVWKLLFVDG